jgi:uncharacterized protein (TIGR00730 family)
MLRVMRRVCVFCGSSPGAGPDYAALARRLGQALAASGVGLVYGGAQVGLMGIVADSALAAGGSVVGVIPRALEELELAHRGLTELHVVESMHERKALMAELSDGFIALPGGMGTLEELFEVLTWAQLGMHRKPCGLLDVGGYFTRLLGFLDHMVEQGFLRPVHRAMVLVESEPDRLLGAFRTYQAPAVVKWIDRAET